MRQLIAALLGIVLTWSSAQAAAVSFKASDGGMAYADATPAAAAAKGTILLFHQAGSNRAEYLPIAPKLAALGYNVLAVDQRAGGDMWNHENQTAAAHGRGADFLEALPDLEGALAYTRTTWTGVPVVAWGSSYSASLAFFLAAKHPDAVAAVLSFSPGEYFPGTSVRDQAARTHCPVFVTSASGSGEVAEAKRLLEAVPDEHKVQYVPQHGVRDSSTLRTDANPAGAAAAWAAVTDEVLDELAQHPDVLALSFHVDYGDNLGWKDLYSLPQATARQRRYAALLGSQSDTPQLVIDGKAEAIGSDRSSINALLRQVQPVGAQASTHELDRRFGIRVDAVAGSRRAVAATIPLVTFDPSHKTSVRGGENGGRYLQTYNDVRSIGRWDGQAVTLNVPRDGADLGERAAVIVQSKDGGVWAVAMTNADAT